MRNRRRLGALIFTSLLLVTPIIGAVADPTSEPEGAKPESVTETRTESSNATRSKESTEGADKETPDDSFIPSESISADSAISFPVDI